MSPSEVAPTDATDRVRRIMLDVLLALIPALAIHFWLAGVAVLINLLLCVLASLLLEAATLRLRQRPIRSALGDGSALLTAILLALSLPPLCPWWLPVTGAGVAILLGKHAYGGLGLNLFNPAMLGLAVLLVSFPANMSSWPVPGLQLPIADALSSVFLGTSAPGLDATSGATALDHLRGQLALQRTVSEISGDEAMGHLASRGWEWTAVGYLLGGLYLLWRRRIRWQIPLSMLAALSLVSMLFWLGDADRFPSPLFHFAAGATLMGAFFIATDPVTACSTPRGRLAYGAGIGVLVYLIRTWGGYPDGLAFAVLLMNAAAPALDAFLRPRVRP
jgi:electron transport complex protein RnfD